MSFISTRALISCGVYFLPSMSMDQSVPMCRLTDRMVRSTLVTAWRLATSPTSTSPFLAKATTDGVVLEGGEPTVIANAEGSRTTPSVVAFAKNGEVLVGEVAKRQAVTNVDRTIRSVKRHMGTDWSVDIDGKKYTAQEISARVLQKLKRDAEAYLGERSPTR